MTEEVHWLVPQTEIPTDPIRPASSHGVSVAAKTPPASTWTWPNSGTGLISRWPTVTWTRIITHTTNQIIEIDRGVHAVVTVAECFSIYNLSLAGVKIQYLYLLYVYLCAKAENNYFSRKFLRRQNNSVNVQTPNTKNWILKSSRFVYSYEIQTYL